MDRIQIEILDDGQIKMQTSDISEKNHMSADELLDSIEDMMGGERQTEKVEHEFWKNRQVQRGGRIVKTKA